MKQKLQKTSTVIIPPAVRRGAEAIDYVLYDSLSEAIGKVSEDQVHILDFAYKAWLEQPKKIHRECGNDICVWLDDPEARRIYLRKALLWLYEQVS